jgi:hypothetical protein
MYLNNEDVDSVPLAEYKNDLCDDVKTEMNRQVP